MGRSFRRRGSDDDGGGGANWMDTYGDMVTLLLTFFVLLFSFSTIDAVKWQQLLVSFSGSTFSAIPAIDLPAASEPPIQSINYRIENQQQQEEQNLEDFNKLLDNISAYIEGNGMQVQIMAIPETKTIILRLADNVLFSSGSATILPEFYGNMDHLVTLFNDNIELISMIRIEGHTDNRPIHTEQFTDNWALSAGRAQSVLLYFIESGRIDTTKISITGYGEFHPVADNDTPEGRAANRRVDFVIESVNIQ